VPTNVSSLEAIQVGTILECLRCRSLTHRLVRELLHSAQFRPSVLKIGNPDRDAILTLCEAMDDHPEYDWKAKQMALDTRHSETHFYRVFKAVTTLTPHQRAIEARVRRAKKLLAGHDQTVTEIALAVGCGDRDSLAYSSDIQLGLTPEQYREIAWAMEKWQDFPR